MLGTFGDLAPTDGAQAPSRVEDSPPDLPPVDECVPLVPSATLVACPRRSPGGSRSACTPATPGSPAADPAARCGSAAGSGCPTASPSTPWRSCSAADAYPPTIFNADLPVGWTPTVELTTHVRARPAPGWLRCAFTTRFVTGGFLEEDGVVWDDTGALVAQSRQLALVPRPA